MSGNYIDIKHTIWQRYHFSDDTDMLEIAQRLQNHEDVVDNDLGFKECEDLAETLDQLAIEDNNGDCTIEVYEKEQELWNNVEKFDV